VTTHDLALTELVAGLGHEAANVHFEDQMSGNTLAFDYTMRAADGLGTEERHRTRAPGE
jgi:hypothetical protein